MPGAKAEPSAWVSRFVGLIVAGGATLDLACGRGRHARFLESRGHRVHAVDRDSTALAELADLPEVRCTQADLEGEAWPLAGMHFDGIVVANYLHRPLFEHLADALAERGVLIYETFMQGHERLGRPTNPAFLLRPGELLDAFGASLTVVAFEQGEVVLPGPAVVQRLCAVKGPAASVHLPGS